LGRSAELSVAQLHRNCGRVTFSGVINTSAMVEHFSMLLPLMTTVQPPQTSDSTDYYELTRVWGRWSSSPD
jgi:hypothetical protein